MEGDEMREKQLREKLKKLVIMGCHSECETYDEALEKELGFGCEVQSIYDDDGETIIFENRITSAVYRSVTDTKFDFDNLPELEYQVENRERYFTRNDFDKIIGQLITIGRVLQSIGEDEEPKGFSKYSISTLDKDGTGHNYFISSKMYLKIKAMRLWKLTTKEGQEATDYDQTIETIKALVSVLEGDGC